MSDQPRPLPASFQALVDYIAERYRSAVEIGVGRFPDVALALRARGIPVRATDIRPLYDPELEIIRDDVTRPVLSVYQGSDLLYSLRPPPELIGCLQELAARLASDLIVKPLASEIPLGRLVQKGRHFFYLWPFSGGDRSHETIPA